MSRVTLYTRAACCLCEDAKQVLAAARARMAFEFEEIDIDRNPEWLALYNEEVPVIAIDGHKAFKYKVTMDELLKKLKARA
jgi:glutaredoxin